MGIIKSIGKPEIKHLRRMCRLLAAISICAAVMTVLFLLISGGADKIRLRYAASEIMKSREGYSVILSYDSIVYYTERDKEYAKIVSRIINTYLPLLCADFELLDIPAATVIIYPSKEKMYASIGYSGAEGAPVPMGAYSAGIITMLSPSYWINQSDGHTEIEQLLSNGPVIHELAHLALDKKTNGNYKEWFSEGTALFYENKYTGYEVKSNARGGNISYAGLSEGFKYIDKNDGYRKSYNIIKYIYEQKGAQTLKKIYGRLEKGESFDKALRKELGLHYFALDNL